VGKQYESEKLETEETVIPYQGADGITVKMVIIILMSVAIVLILTTIKIYLSNQIYYESRSVNKIERVVSALKAERVLLQQNIEALKFKNRVTDTIFILDNMEE